MPTAVDITQIEQYCREHKTELLALAMTGSNLFKDFTVLPGIKDEYVLTTLKVGNILKPYNKTWAPASGQAVLVPRTLKVRLGKVEMEEEPLAYRKTFLAKVLSGGVNPDEHPFEAFLMEMIMMKLKDDVNLSLIWQGVFNAAGSTPGSVNDGFLKIVADLITALVLAPIVTGVIDATNAVAKLKAMYRALPKAYREVPIKIYCNHDTYDAYCDNYQTVHGSLPYNAQYEQVYLEGSNKLAIFAPQSGYGNSKRVIMTPQDNMSIGIDLESDMEKIGVMKNTPWVIMIYAAINFGVQINQIDALFVNDQA